MVTQIKQGFPKASLPFVNLDNGTVLQPWLQWLIAIFERTGGSQGIITGGAVQTIAVGASPFTYTAPNQGYVWIQEGTYCGVVWTRTPTILNYGNITRGIFPVTANDLLTVTFTTLVPVMYFIPT